MPVPVNIPSMRAEASKAVAPSAPRARAGSTEPSPLPAKPSLPSDALSKTASWANGPPESVREPVGGPAPSPAAVESAPPAPKRHVPIAPAFDPSLNWGDMVGDEETMGRGVPAPAPADEPLKPPGMNCRRPSPPALSPAVPPLLLAQILCVYVCCC